MNDPIDPDHAPVRGGDLLAAGVPTGPIFGMAIAAVSAAIEPGGAHLDRNTAIAALQDALAQPDRHLDDPHFGGVAAAAHATAAREAKMTFTERDAPAPWQSWCSDADPGALEQMANAMRLPSTVRGALMPDAHRGYGLPIGGVLATEGTVVPYAVGVDIACRMKLSVFDIDPAKLDKRASRFESALTECTLFGKAMAHKPSDRADHEVLDESRWNGQQLLRSLRDRAWAQLGSSGSGNHFVEFGELTLDQPDLGLQPGTYLAVMSHSGSRGPGAMIAGHFSKLARAQHPELPPELSHLAWLDLDTEDGQAYWDAMNLMGDFASASHAIIHERLREYLGAETLAGIENHHNFAWKEQHDGRELIVHRKGATPAGNGVLGVIPGSMAAPAFVVRGKGSEASLESAAHGAGRLMSRTAAKERFQWSDVTARLRDARVKVLAAGIDENPFVYKDIHEVMAQQADLVDVVARFDPRIVRMADGGEPPED